MIWVGDVYQTHTKPDYSIYFCPWWFQQSEQFAEVLANYNHYQSHNLSSYWTGGNIPRALDRAIQAFGYGYNIGREERRESERRRSCG